MNDSFILTTERITKRFGRATVVDGLNLRVPRSSIYGFLGPNGAGKTTTIRLLLGLARPDSGKVSLFGLTLREHRKTILQKVGALIEEPALYPRLTGRENLQVLARLIGIRANRVEQALRQVELLDVADRIAGQYSQGMKQRLGLAMALLNEPQLLILDEPTNGLDPSGIREIRELLKRLAAESEITVFLSSHLLSEIERLATHLGVIHRGRLLFQGALQELHRACEPRIHIKTNNPLGALEVLRGQMVNCHLTGKDSVAVDSKCPEAIANVNRLLVQRGLEVYGIVEHSPRLEDLFLELTGKENGSPWNTSALSVLSC